MINAPNGAASAVLKRGDLVGVQAGGNRHLHALTEDVTLDASGDGTVAVAPTFLTSVFAVGSTLNFDSPRIRMVIDESTLDVGREGYTRGLLAIRGWQSMTVTQAAQAVQISAYPDHYAKWEASAWAWLYELT